jgi:Calcineurin-like phosphoesterase
MGYRAAAIVVALLFVALGPQVPTPAAGPLAEQAGLLAAWVELGPGGAALARAVTDRATCPSAVLNGQAQPMQVRTAASAAYAVLVCELTIPEGTTNAAVEGQALPLPRRNPRRILVVGDSGCRIASFAAQACNDPAAWPFARVAQSAASFAPDLVIHVGDYVYREASCPAGFAGCAGSPTGDTWPTWQADFFAPAQPLLRAAPWVVVRGNHEDCDREGLGWFRLLDPHPLPAGCLTLTEPYAVPLGDLQLLVFDDSAAPNDNPAPDLVAAYAAQVAQARALASDRAWFLVHTGLRVIGHLGVENGVEQLYRNSTTLAAAGALDLPAGVQLSLGGHTHLYEALGFNPRRPPQIVSGNAGTELDDPVTTRLEGLPVFDTTVAYGTNGARFGYFTVLPLGRGWSFTERDVGGAAVTTCAAVDLSLTCASGVVVPGQNAPPSSGQPGLPCTMTVGGRCTTSGAVAGSWTRTGSGSGGAFAFSAGAAAGVAPSGTPAVFIPSTSGVESLACAALAAAPPFTTSCQGATRGAALQGATVTVRFPVAGGGTIDVGGTLYGPPVVAPPQPLAPVSPFGLPGVPCVGSFCAVWLPLPPLPPIVLPPPPLPLLIPVVPLGPERAGNAAEAPVIPERPSSAAAVPVIPEADPLVLLALGFAALGVLLGLRRLPGVGGRQLLVARGRADQPTLQDSAEATGNLVLGE